MWQFHEGAVPCCWAAAPAFVDARWPSAVPTATCVWAPFVRSSSPAAVQPSAEGDSAARNAKEGNKQTAQVQGRKRVQKCDRCWLATSFLSTNPCPSGPTNVSHMERCPTFSETKWERGRLTSQLQCLFSTFSCLVACVSNITVARLNTRKTVGGCMTKIMCSRFYALLSCLAFLVFPLSTQEDS